MNKLIIAAVWPVILIEALVLLWSAWGIIPSRRLEPTPPQEPPDRPDPSNPDDGMGITGAW